MQYNRYGKRTNIYLDFIYRQNITDLHSNSGRLIYQQHIETLYTQTFNDTLEQYEMSIVFLINCTYERGMKVCSAPGCCIEHNLKSSSFHYHIRINQHPVKTGMEEYSQG